MPKKLQLTDSFSEFYDAISSVDNPLTRACQPALDFYGQERFVGDGTPQNPGVTFAEAIAALASGEATSAAQHPLRAASIWADFCLRIANAWLTDDARAEFVSILASGPTSAARCYRYLSRNIHRLSSPEIETLRTAIGTDLPRIPGSDSL